MLFISASQAAENWNLDIRSVQRHCKNGRIPGAVKDRSGWAIPADAEKPGDRRGLHCAPPEYLPYLLVCGVFPVDTENPLRDMADPELKLQFQAEWNYLKGKMESVTGYAVSVPRESKVYLCACMIGIYAAVNACSYDVFDTLYTQLRETADFYPGTLAGHLAQAGLASVSISLSDLKHVPDWVACGDFSTLPALARPWAFYQYAKYLRATERYETAYTVAMTTQQLIANSSSVTLCDIYLRMACASSAHYMGMEKEAEKHLLKAIDPIAKNHFITPLAETVTNYGSVIEKCLRKSAPDLYDPIIRQSKTNWYNWIRFHNRFVDDEVTTLLTLQELYLARLLADGVSYSQAAERMDLSLGRIRNLASNIYGKLNISGKSGLKSFLIY